MSLEGPGQEGVPAAFRQGRRVEGLHQGLGGVLG